MRVLILTSILCAISTAALAADVQEAPPADIDPARFGWTGFYVGASAGYAWLEDVDESFVPGLEDEGDDWNFGGHVGYQQQFDSFVLGVEGEAQSLDINYETFSFIKVEEAYTVKARAGLAYDRFLFTGHLGGTYLTTNIGLEDWGGVAGGGIDYAVTDNIIVGAQYSHHWFNDFDNTLIDGTLDAVSARVSYKF